MIFEWDENKSKANMVKHGISFSQAAAIFLDPNAVILPTNTVGEVRTLIIGQAIGKLWTAVYTMRDTNTRIISVRRSRKEEENIYG